MFSHQQFNSPESIQARNKEKLLAEFKQKKDKEQDANKRVKRLKTKVSLDIDDEKNLEVEAALELGMRKKSTTTIMSEKLMDIDHDVKFIPLPPPVKELIASPLGKNHTRGARTARLTPIENYDGVQDMLIIFDAIKRQPSGYFQYFTHTFSKNSVNYNFYNVK